MSDIADLQEIERLTREIGRLENQLHIVAEDRNVHWRLCEHYEAQLKIANDALSEILVTFESSRQMRMMAKAALAEIAKKERGMKLTDLSKPDLSRWLAERMEAKPEDPDSRLHNLSDTDWWLIRDSEWRPVPYDDPEIAMRLLKWLLWHDRFDVIIDKTEIECTPTRNAWDKGWRGFLKPISDQLRLERAIAEAAALALGCKP